MTALTPNVLPLAQLAAKSLIVCKNCGQRIDEWVLVAVPKFPEDREWRHVCENPGLLNHPYLHTSNDPDEKRKPCYFPEPRLLA